MNLTHAGPPHTRPVSSTGQVMRWVLLATLPGIATLTWLFGWGVLINVLAAAGLAVALEALILSLRSRPLRLTLRDNSALVSGVLLGASLPPASPWWLIVVGMVAAIVVAKQLFGGLGQNPFNPAMVGYALLLIAFPLPMTQWAAPHGLLGIEAVSPGEALSHFLGLAAPADALTGATPLDAFKHKPATVLASEFWASEPLPPGTLNAWHSVALAWLAGGALLLYRRLISWHIPAAMLGSMLLISGVMYAGDPSHHGTPLFHLLGGAAVFGAFFIATDPVSAATSRKGKLIYGAGIGVLIMTIRRWGAYPDAVAFAVLLMNFAVPFIDYYTQPRTYGHARANRGIGTGRNTRRIDKDEERP